MRWVACFLLFLSSAVLLLSCSVFVGTPMHGKCRYLPTVEECQDAANQYITDECLRKCIRYLCAEGNPKCDADEDILLQCATSKTETEEEGGYVLDLYARSCTQPVDEVNWCQRPLTPPCQQQNIVHEFAHACGWRHKQGKGVPGNDGRVKCK
jgi:hypothetical protein